VKLAAVVQARMSSTRFPGKMLHVVRGKPLLEYVLDRARLSEHIDLVVVATSVESTDTPIATYCAASGVECFRGSLGDVAGRFLEACEFYELDAFVRICGDSPLLDAALIDRGVQEFLESGADVVTNVSPRTFPAGQSVEVVRTTVFRDACARMTRVEHFEHVTGFLYQHAREYRVHNFTNPAGNESEIDLSVNTPAGMSLFERLIEHGEDTPALPATLRRYRAMACS
jgi:spore coat polysaccharide biosynthesis protein SpsF